MALTARVSDTSARVLLAALVVVSIAVALWPASGGRPLEVVTRAGFGPPDDRSDGRTRWLETDTGLLEVTVRGRARHAVLHAELSSFDRLRRVVVTMAGRDVAVGRVPPATFVTLRADLGVLPEGRHEVEVRASPGPQSIAATIGIPDPRLVSVRLRALSATQVPAP